MRKIILALIALLLMVSPLFAADGDIMTNDGIRVDSYGVIVPVVGIKAKIKLETTNDTVTAVQTGNTFIVTATVPTVITLPSAAANLQYTIAAGYNTTVSVDPADTSDTIKYLASMVGGDKLNSAGATGDSVTLVGGDASTWYVTQMKGAWVDGN